MQPLTTSHSGSPEFGSFVTALREIFRDEQWHDVESYAERAWHACGLADEAAWAEVRDRVRDAWPTS